MSFTRYEKARLVGSRALQLASGAPFGIKLSEKELGEMHYSPIEIAKREFDEGLLPIEVKQPTPKEKLARRV